MKILLDDSRDTHLIYVEKYGESSLNIIVRVLINAVFSEQVYSKASAALARKHPYVIGRVMQEKSEIDEPRFYMEVDYNNKIKCDFCQVDSAQLYEELNTLSIYQKHRFNHAAGDLLHLQVWSDSSKSLIEMSCTHLLGEVQSVVMLMSDFLDFVNQSVRAEPKVDEIGVRYQYDERRYGWLGEKQMTMPLPLPVNAINDNPWSLPDYRMKRFSMPLTHFKSVNSWLRSKSMEAKAIDVFYFVAARILRKCLQRDVSFWIIFSYRQLLVNKSERDSINNEAVFCPILVTEEHMDDLEHWIANFHLKRQECLSLGNIMAINNFFRNLNKSMHNTPLDEGRKFLNAYIHMPDFAFNNYGDLSNFFVDRDNFSIQDVDVQDAVPTQEVRMFGFREQLKFSPSFFVDGLLTPQQFWDDFNIELAELLSVAK